MSALFGSSRPPLEAGDPAPDASALTDAGTRLNLRDLYAANRWTLVYFYPKADTPGCTRQGCSLRDGYAELTARGVVVVGVSKDDIATQAAFKAKHRLPFVLLADTEGAVIEAFGVPTYPLVGHPRRQAYLIRDGRVVHADHAGTTDEQAAAILRLVEQWDRHRQ